MTFDPTDVQPFLESAAHGPFVVRVFVGASGVAVGLWGARLYDRMRHLLAFGLGAVLGASLLTGLSVWLPAVGGPVVVAGSIGTGLAGVVAGALVHRLALVLTGLMAGLALGAGLMGWTGGPQMLVGVLSAIAGGLIFPWVFRLLLEVLTALGGAVMLAWALGLALEPWAVGVFWVAGAVIQLGAFRSVEEKE